jgi:F-type H+-transporting ATPase subunit delta
LHAWLDGYVTALVDRLALEGSLGTVESELAAVESLIEHDTELGGVMTDVGVPIASRAAVMEELLAGKVDAATVKAVRRVVERERADELPIALHQAYEIAHRRVLADSLSSDVESAAETETSPEVSRMAGRAMLAGYAAAVLESLGSVQEIEEVEDELFRFTRIVEADRGLRAALGERALPLEVRQGVVDELLGTKVHHATLRLAREALRERARDVVASFDWLVEQAALARGWRVARVRAASPLDDGERARLAGALQAMSGVPVELQVTLDADLLAGAVVEIGDLLIDASASHRLEQLHERLLGTEGTTRVAKEL